MDCILVVDTETTNLVPRNADPAFYELFDAARMVEIAWEVYSAEGVFIRRESFVIIPDGYVIPQISINIHGITNEVAHAEGTTLHVVWASLRSTLATVSTIVAHNIAFDNAIILSEMHRYNANADSRDLVTDIVSDGRTSNTTVRC